MSRSCPVRRSAFTLLEFSWMPLRLLRRLGFTYTDREVAGVYALWRWVGHLIGVPADLNPADELQAGRMLELRELTAGPADEDSRELVRRLLIEHYDPAYRRSSHKNFTHLAHAHTVQIARADDAAFSAAAASLLDTALVE